MLALARSARAVKRDGYLNTRARQVLRFVLPRLSRPRRRSAPSALTASRDRCGFRELRTSTIHPPRRDRDRVAVIGSCAAPLVASGAHRLDGQKHFLSFRNAGHAKRVEVTAARRQNAYRSTAGGLLESARQRALQLHLKHTKRDGHPNGRA